LSISLAHLLSFQESTIFPVLFSILFLASSLALLGDLSDFKQTYRQADRQPPILFISSCLPSHLLAVIFSELHPEAIARFPPTRFTDFFSSNSQCRFVLWSCLLYSSPDIRLKTSPSDAQSLCEFPKKKIMFCHMFLISIANRSRTLTRW